MKGLERDGRKSSNNGKDRNVAKIVPVRKSIKRGDMSAFRKIIVSNKAKEGLPVMSNVRKQRNDQKESRGKDVDIW